MHMRGSEQTKEGAYIDSLSVASLGAWSNLPPGARAWPVVTGRPCKFMYDKDKAGHDLKKRREKGLYSTLTVALGV